MKIRVRHLAVSGCLAVLATTGSLTAAAADDPSPAGPALHRTGESPPAQMGGPAMGQDHGQQPWMQDPGSSPSGDGELPGHGDEETPGPRSEGGTTPSDAPSHPMGHGHETPHTSPAPTPSHTHTHTHTPKPSSTPPAETPTPTPPHTPTPSTPASTPSTRPPELAETGDTTLWMLAGVAAAAVAAGAGCLVLGRRAGR
ncbi:hypothetical protein [Streptomyces sp. NPDC021622]|uniref:hypothetical protein n=1 Tax=Streptomyces sp. NPDC021622 TaxID=3155013 RepID=UPI0033DCEA68